MSRVTTRDIDSTVNNDCDPNPDKRAATTKKIKIYRLPPKERGDLCFALENIQEKDNDFWKTFAKQMGLDDERIQDISRRFRNKQDCIFDELLIILGDEEKSVNDLFVSLGKLKQFDAMNAIKNVTDEKYHWYFRQQEVVQPEPTVGPDISDLLRNTSIDGASSNTESNIPVVVNETSSTVGRSSSSDNTSNTPNTDTSTELKKHEFLDSVPEISYEKLTIATNNWHPDNILGRGGFGTVFRGVWTNTAVAIKRIELKDKNSTADYKLELKQSFNELRFLNACRHDNVLPLYGYSLTGGKPCLVYQLMTGGTLEQKLYSKYSLTWQQKYSIALGTARGLQFLHTFREKPLIHGDIKPANILLDQCLQPKIGDFGLTRESPSQNPIEISKVYGTRPYLPVEFIETRCLSTKIDTYSFGIVMYEMASQKRVYDKNRVPQHIIELMRKYFDGQIFYTNIVDSTYPFDQCASYIFSVLTCLGRDCTATDPQKRPEMVDVLKRIDYCTQQQQQASALP